MPRKLARATLALATAVVLLTACSGSPDESTTPTDAPDTGSSEDIALLGGQENADYLADLYQQAVDAGQTTITVYGVTATSSASLYEAFMARYPEIYIDHVTIFGTELQQRVASEQATGQYLVDQVSVSGADAVYLSDNDLIAEQDPPLAAQLDDVFMPAGNTLFGGNTYLYTLSYNTDLVDPEDVPRSFEELLEPQWAGKIGRAEFTSGAPGFLFAPYRAGIIDDAWLEEFSQHDLVVFPTERDVFTAVSTGQIELGLGNYIRGEAFLAVDNLPVAFVADFEDGVSDGVFYRGTVRNAPNALASDLLTAWWLTPEAQALIAIQGQPGLMPGAPPVPGQPPLSEIKVNPGPTFDEYAQYSREGLELFRSIFG